VPPRTHLIFGDIEGKLDVLAAVTLFLATCGTPQPESSRPVDGITMRRHDAPAARALSWPK
jgi:hypothetical protein